MGKRRLPPYQIAGSTTLTREVIARSIPFWAGSPNQQVSIALHRLSSAAFGKRGPAPEL